jgi:hypothetical protein
VEVTGVLTCLFIMLVGFRPRLYGVLDGHLQLRAVLRRHYIIGPRPEASALFWVSRVAHKGVGEGGGSCTGLW